jgi:hypothetical protein
MQALLDPAVPFDVTLLDTVIEIFFDPRNPQVILPAWTGSLCLIHGCDAFVAVLHRGLPLTPF